MKSVCKLAHRQSGSANPSWGLTLTRCIWFIQVRGCEVIVNVFDQSGSGIDVVQFNQSKCLFGKPAIKMQWLMFFLFRFYCVLILYRNCGNSITKECTRDPDFRKTRINQAICLPGRNTMHQSQFKAKCRNQLYLATWLWNNCIMQQNNTKSQRNTYSEK